MDMQEISVSEESARLEAQAEDEEVVMMSRVDQTAMIQAEEDSAVRKVEKVKEIANHLVEDWEATLMVEGLQGVWEAQEEAGKRMEDAIVKVNEETVRLGPGQAKAKEEEFDEDNLKFAQRNTYGRSFCQLFYNDFQILFWQDSGETMDGTQSGIAEIEFHRGNNMKFTVSVPRKNIIPTSWDVMELYLAKKCGQVSGDKFE